ncbi:MAG: hypothetical protein RR561_07030 [Peptostreptococcus sp.]|uniref:hypothetical protein n=1 Tax=Peptostreptococcus sp. TaxID=1262 RepID=UPI002FCBDDB6
MKNRKKAGFITTAIIIIEILIIFSMRYLERLAYKKAGVNHHLIFKKAEYTLKYLTPSNIKILTLLTAGILIVLILVLLREIKKSSFIIFLPLINTIVAGLLLEFSLHSKYMAGELIYPYWILAIILCMIISIVNYGINKILCKDKIA